MIIYSNRGVFIESVMPSILAFLASYYLLNKNINIYYWLLLAPVTIYAIIKFYRYARKRAVIIFMENSLIFRGIFKTIKVAELDIKGVQLKNNFYCKIFDWNLLYIQTKDGVIQKIYTPEFNVHQFNKYLNT